MTITREEATGLYPTILQLSQALGYKTPEAIYMWKKGKPIPESAYMKLRYQLKPEAFREDGTLRAKYK